MNRQKFFNGIRPIFGGYLTDSQVEGTETILDAWERHGDDNPRHLAYILATAKHETAHTMQPVRETLAKSDAKAKEILSKAWKSGKLPWVKRDYWSSGFFGRGFVQITHAENYRKAGQKLSLDLVSDPSKTLEPEVAGAILVRGMLEGWFTGKSLSDFPDFLNMRRVVNGMDRAELIANFANGFYEAISSAADNDNPPKKTGWLARLVSAIMQAMRRLKR